MKLMKELLVLVIVCFFSNGYAMENGQDNSIREVINMRDQIIKATTIMASKDRAINMSIFKSPEAAECYNRQETHEARCAIAQAYNSWVLVSADANARLEHRQAVNSLLDQAVELREKIGDGSDL
jgi:SUMO ligase MMS21 Smc5/6 complex component